MFEGNGFYRSADHDHDGAAAFVEAVATARSAAAVLAIRRAQASRWDLPLVGPVIYAIHLFDGLVKIGHTRNLRSRLQDYRISRKNLHRLLMLQPGSLEDEQRLHRHFAIYAARGREYYEPVPQVIDYINAVRRQMGVRPLAFPLVDIDQEPSAA